MHSALTNFPRNPEATERPSFEQLVVDLTRVEALVLNIPQQLLDKYPQCGELGGALSAGKVMYKDIQTMYCSEELGGLHTTA